MTESFTNPLKALEYLRSHDTDLLFIDVNMPELTGLQLLKSLPTAPMVVFTTAYPEFGAESYEFNAIDYLLKPFVYERFLKATLKAFDKYSSNNVVKNLSDSKKAKENPDFVLVKSGTQLNRIKTDTILYIEGAGNYMTFYTTGKKILTYLKMLDVIELLSSDKFVRIHKSYIVAVERIEIIERHRVIIGGKPIPIGASFRDEFLKKFAGGN
jgi:DNA-binding LytR/AlgR family response regulator